MVGWLRPKLHTAYPPEKVEVAVSGAVEEVGTLGTHVVAVVTDRAQYGRKARVHVRGVEFMPATSVLCKGGFEIERHVRAGVRRRTRLWRARAERGRAAERAGVTRLS